MTKKTALAISPFTMPAALAAADTLFEAPTWYGDPDNIEQAAWLESFRRRAELAAGMPEIHRHATESLATHADWLRGEGWDAQITQGSANAHEQDVFLAATLNIVAKWREVGRAYREGEVDRVLLKAGAFTSEVRSGEHPVVEVITQHPSFSFCFQQVDVAPADAAQLASRALDMVTRNAREKVHLDFPMVDLLVRDDAKYMIGLRSGANEVTQAAEQLRLELNEVGGRASAAAEVAITRSLDMTRKIKIDGPFVVAINRNGQPNNADKVAFAAYCDREVWKAPATGRI